MEERGITVHACGKRKEFSFGVLIRLIELVRNRRFDLIVSYLSGPNFYAELVPFSAGSKLVVSERTSHHDDKAPARDWLRRAMHVLSNKVVTNSRSHCEWLKQKWWLRGKTSYIYNGIDLQRFQPGKEIVNAAAGLHLIGIGRIGPEKNILNLIAALDLVQKQSGDAPQISWAGLRDQSQLGMSYSRSIDEALERSPESAVAGIGWASKPTSLNYCIGIRR